MPTNPSDTRCLVGGSRTDFYSDRERHIMRSRVLLDDPRKVVKLSGIGPRRVLVLLKNYRLWGHMAINIISLAPKGGLGTFGPLIVKQLGFSSINASALNTVSNFGVVFLALLCAWVSDKVSSRGPLCLVAAVYSIAFSAAMFGVVESKNKWLRYAMFTMQTSGNAVAQSVNDAWMSVNMDDPQARCVGMALAVAGSNLGGLAGVNLFKQSDAPRYVKGFLGVSCLYSASIVMILVMMGVYWNDNRRMAKSMSSTEDFVREDGADIVRGDGAATKVKNQL